MLFSHEVQPPQYTPLQSDPSYQGHSSHNNVRALLIMQQQSEKAAPARCLHDANNGRPSYPLQNLFVPLVAPHLHSVGHLSVFALGHLKVFVIVYLIGRIQDGRNLALPVILNSFNI